jgi:hypothetical protein
MSTLSLQENIIVIKNCMGVAALFPPDMALPVCSPKRLVVILAAVLEVPHRTRHHSWKFSVHGQERVLVYNVPDQLQGCT